jgi:alpha-D-ribose 1-methylphosphonate 5-triphosphate synthase subunit PhnH
MSWDSVHDSRETFLQCLWAQCRPGVPQGPLPRCGLSADPDLDAAAAILLSLLDPGLVLAAADAGEAGDVAAALCRLTGATPGAVDDADFVLVSPGSGMVATRARRGNAVAPERGATVVYSGGCDPVSVELRGPGIEDVARVELPLHVEELADLVSANAAAPAGVDTFVVVAAHVVAVPRSVSLRIGA